MTVKGKNVWWHISNSLWVLMALIPLVYWMPFFYMGLKLEDKKYKLVGGINLALFICFFVGLLTELSDLCLELMCIHMLVHFILCLVFRKKYLRRLGQKEARQRVEQVLVQSVPVQQEPPAVQAVPVEEKLNVNSCTEEELCALPGISIIEAKKMSDLRQTRGDFATVEEFIAAIGIKPHVAVRIVDRLYAEPTVTRVAVKAAGRVLDF